MHTKNGLKFAAQKMWILLSWMMVGAMLLSGCGASKESKSYRVGILSGLNAFSPAVEGFKSKMTELGYVEGENITYDLQSTNVDIAAYQAITKKFVDDKVDLIFAFPTEAAMEAKLATQGTDIPVVFALAFTDAPGVNLVDSVREPGGNITGVRFPSAPIASRRLKILLEMAPHAKRIFVPYLKDYPNVPGQLDAIRPQAVEQSLTLFEYAATSPQDLQAELDSLILSTDVVRIDGILLLAEPLGITPDFYSVLGKFSYEHKIPIGGALMSIEGEYSSIFGLLPDAKIAGEQAALLASKIFRGSSAGAIPVITSESNFKINYKASQDLGVIIPGSLLAQADEIIQ